MKKGIVILIIFMIALEMTSSMVYGATKDGGSPRWRDLNFKTSLFKKIYLASIIINILLLLSLLFIYISSFRKTKSSFTLGLVFFIGVLLVQRLLLFIFPLIPHFFETLALTILLMLSLE